MNPKSANQTKTIEGRLNDSEKEAKDLRQGIGKQEEETRSPRRANRRSTDDLARLERVKQAVPPRPNLCLAILSQLRAWQAEEGVPSYDPRESCA